MLLAEYALNMAINGSLDKVLLDLLLI